jgi:hypothetical protein
MRTIEVNVPKQGSSKKDGNTRLALLNVTSENLNKGPQIKMG